MSRLDRRTTRVSDRIAEWREKWERRFEPDSPYDQYWWQSKEFWTGVIVGVIVTVLLAALIAV